MRKKKALDHFLGRNGVRRMNCAQAVAMAFKDQALFSEEDLAMLAAYGNGRAPEGYCGSAYAAIIALEKISRRKADEFKDIFLANAGSLECSKIRRARKLTCLQCVEVAVDFVSTNYSECL